MAFENTVNDLAALTTPKLITRENVDELLDSRRIQIHMKGGNWWDMRRNGATKRWRRDPNRIYIPFKYGFKFYGNLTEADFSVRREGEPHSLDTLYFRIEPAAELQK